MPTPRRPAALAAALLVLLTACGGADPATSTSSPSAPPPPTGAPCSPDVPAGDGSLVHDGRERTYAVHLPAGRPGPLPLVVLLHGHRGSGEQITATTGLPARATDLGFVVVVPDGLGPPARWNFDGRPDGPDDGAFLDALVAHLVADACIDPERVALVGSSNGAAFAGTQACGTAAVVMVLATVVPACPGRPPSILTIRGTADATVPYDGTPTMVDQLATDLGCRPEPSIDSPHPGVERATYAGCGGGTSVVLDAVEGAVHAWPGGSDASRADNSDAGRTFDATAEVLTFLRAEVDQR